MRFVCKYEFFILLVLCGGSALAPTVRVQACAGSPTYVLRAVVLSFPLCAPFVWSGVGPVLPFPLSGALCASASVVCRKDSGAVHARTAAREGTRSLHPPRRGQGNDSAPVSTSREHAHRTHHEETHTGGQSAPSWPQAAPQNTQMCMEAN
jgi:hypothetical protein